VSRSIKRMMPSALHAPASKHRAALYTDNWLIFYYHSTTTRLHHDFFLQRTHKPVISDMLIYLRQRRKYVFARVRLSACLSVCEQDYSKRRAWIWIKCYVSTDVGTWTNWLTFEHDPYYNPDARTGLFSPISLQRGILLRRENPTYIISSSSSYHIIENISSAPTT